METKFTEMRLLNASDISKILKVSRSFAYKLMRTRIIPTVKILGASRVRPEDLGRYIEENISK